MAKSTQKTPEPGWAVYLRTSSEEAQNPENSQSRQRFAIENSLFNRIPMPVYREYIDNLSGRSAANRPGFQQMLEDAREGHFSHVAVENAERFGRNDTEALVAIDALHELGVAVRFADYPESDPIDPDDRIIVSLSFTLARRESLKLGQRTTGGMHSRQRDGGFVARAPDGYVNCEKRVDQTDNKLNASRYVRWIEPDPEQFKVWRMAWDLLLTGQHSLAEICQQLHACNYTFRSGRSLVTVMSDGRTKTPTGALSRIFNNWFYAGWVVSEAADIPPKTIRGKWEPLVTTKEFERGLEILSKRRQQRPGRTRVHEYMLIGLLFVELENGKVYRLTGSTPNTSRPAGSRSFYRQHRGIRASWRMIRNDC